VSERSASLIIASWNGKQLLARCLPRVLEAAAGQEVIVVDDGSEDGSAAFVRESFPSVRVLALPRNLGFAGANDAAAEVARGEVLVFLNNDMLVEPDFLPPLLSPFDDESVFAVTARIEMQPRPSPRGVIQETGLVRTRWEKGFLALVHERPVGEEVLPVFYGGGGSTAFRRDRFLELGGFDCFYRPFYFEDLDLCYRAQKRGWSILFAPASRLHHLHRGTIGAGRFPRSFVETIFHRNYLLFLWRNLGDPRLVKEHLAALRRRLLSGDGDPFFLPGFWRALGRLPSLLAKRWSAREEARLTDRQALAIAARAGQALAFGLPERRRAEDEPAPAGDGRRVMVVGYVPLPFENPQQITAPNYRTWHVVDALLRAGHEVLLAGCRLRRAHGEEEPREEVRRVESGGLLYYAIAPSLFHTGEMLQELHDSFRPEAIVGVATYPAFVAARLDSQAPFWADLYGSAMAEAQAKAQREQDDDWVAAFWEWERRGLARADRISTVSAAQKYAVVGELAAIGRLGRRNYGEDLVAVIPSAIEPRHYRHTKQVLRGKVVGEEDFVVLFSGGYNTWSDTEALFAGVAAAMSEEPRLHFVSTGGAIPGHDEKTYYHFRRLVAGSQHEARFHFLGWRPLEEIPNLYLESDVGVNVDRFSYEALLGCRYRLVDMMRAGLPVVTTLATEISRVIAREGLGLTFPCGDAEGLKEALLRLLREPGLRRRCSEKALAYVFRERPNSRVFAPLLAWARDPRPAPDRATGAWEPRRGWEPRSRLGRFVRAWEREGPAAALAAASKGALRALGTAVGRLVAERWPGRLEAPGSRPGRALLVRTGSTDLLARQASALRSRFPGIELSALAPEQARGEIEATLPEVSLLTAPGARLRIGPRLVSRVRRARAGLIIVAGGGDRRAELLALASGARRKLVATAEGDYQEIRLCWWKLVKVMARGAEKAVLAGAVGLLAMSFRAEQTLWEWKRKLVGRPSPTAGRPRG
jgi:GT2 family glycosyltransferase